MKQIFFLNVILVSVTACGPRLSNSLEINNVYEGASVIPFGENVRSAVNAFDGSSDTEFCGPANDIENFLRLELITPIKLEALRISNGKQNSTKKAKQLSLVNKLRITALHTDSETGEPKSTQSTEIELKSLQKTAEHPNQIVYKLGNPLIGNVFKLDAIGNHDAERLVCVSEIEFGRMDGDTFITFPTQDKGWINDQIAILRRAEHQYTVLQGMHDVNDRVTFFNASNGYRERRLLGLHPPTQADVYNNFELENGRWENGNFTLMKVTEDGLLIQLNLKDSQSEEKLSRSLFIGWVEPNSAEWDELQRNAHLYKEDFPITKASRIAFIRWMHGDSEDNRNFFADLQPLIEAARQMQ